MLRLHFTQPGLKFLRSVRMFDPQQAQTLTFSISLDGIPGYDDKKVILTSEIAGYKLAVILNCHQPLG